MLFEFEFLKADENSLLLKYLLMTINKVET